MARAKVIWTTSRLWVSTQPFPELVPSGRCVSHRHCLGDPKAGLKDFTKKSEGNKAESLRTCTHVEDKVCEVRNNVQDLPRHSHDEAPGPCHPSLLRARATLT